MKIKKIAAAFAAVAMAVSMMAMSASASNFANVTYGDDDPAMATIVSTSSDSFTFAPTADGLQFKAKLKATDLIADPAQVGDITKITATITYDSTAKAPHGWLGGGLWTGGGAQDDWGITFGTEDADKNLVYSGPVSADIEVKFLLPAHHLTADACDMVFIDWSCNAEGNEKLATDGVTITVSNLKFLDKDGNEIAQAEYAGAAVEETAAATEEAPAGDTETAAAGTGNTVAAVAAVMAIAGTAALATKKRK